MKYAIGDSLADYGFSFLEKLHSPIFLMHKSGTIKKVNEAGRKLLSVAHISGSELECFIKMIVIPELARNPIDCQIFPTKRKQLKVISRQLDSSDYLLVELLR